MSIEINGIDTILMRLQKLHDTENIVSAMGKSCASVERSARQKAHKKTGDLRRSIKSKVEDSDTEVKGIVYTPLEYAPYVEYGTGLFARDGNGRQTPWSYQDAKGEWHTTKGQKPQPFLEPALLDNEKNIVKIFKEAIKEGVK